jgi:CBS domain-containing protein
MGRDVVVLPPGMSVVTAARLLRERQLPAAPVTDSPGRCVGVLSATDILRWAAGGGRAGEEGGVPAAGVWCDWQVVDVKPTRRDEVRRHMTRDPLLVTADTPLAKFAEALLDPRRPVVVVDEEWRPLGVVSSTDLLAALASAERRPGVGPTAAAPTDKRARPQRAAPAAT